MAKSVGSIEVVILDILKRPAMEGICSGLGNRGHVGHAAILRRIEILADSNLLDRVERGEHLRERARSGSRPNRTDAIDAERELRGGSSRDGNIVLAIDLYAWLRRQRRERAGGTRGAATDGDRKIGQLQTALGLSHARSLSL